MTLQFYIRGLRENAGLRHRLQQSLERLAVRIAISAAAVVVERESSHAPAFRAYALLAVPGPDIHAEARDHTLEAVWLKVTTALRKQIEQRRSRQEQRTSNRSRKGPRIRAGFPSLANRDFSPIFSCAH